MGHRPWAWYHTRTGGPRKVVFRALPTVAAIGCSGVDGQKGIHLTALTATEAPTKAGAGASQMGQWLSACTAAFSVPAKWLTIPSAQWWNQVRGKDTKAITTSKKTATAARKGFRDIGPKVGTAYGQFECTVPC